jgi:ribonucleoside-diphosphate reductase alpha chain
MTSNEPYLKMMAIIQKFVDQSISTNCSYNPMHYDGESIPLNVIAKDILTAYKYGLKTLYYHNTYDMNEDVDQSSGCESGACSI